MHEAEHPAADLAPAVSRATRWIAVTVPSSIERNAAISAGTRSVLPVFSSRQGQAG